MDSCELITRKKAQLVGKDFMRIEEWISMTRFPFVEILYCQIYFVLIAQNGRMEMSLDTETAFSNAWKVKNCMSYRRKVFKSREARFMFSLC